MLSLRLILSSAPTPHPIFLLQSPAVMAGAPQRLVLSSGKALASVSLASQGAPVRRESLVAVPMVTTPWATGGWCCHHC